MKPLGWILLLLVLCYPPLGLAQGGSIYSSFGFGDRFFEHSAAAMAMGNVSIAVPSVTRIASQNPALWSLGPSTRLETGYIFRQFVKQQADRSIAHNNGKVQGIGLLIPTRHFLRTAVTLGIRPYTTVNFYTSTQQSAGSDGESATIESLGSGGLSQLFIGSSFFPLPNLAIGAALVYTFGKIERSITITFPSGNYRNSFWRHTDRFSSLGAKIGIYYSGISPWYVGVFTELLGTATISRQQQYGTGRLPDTTFDVQFTTPMPLTAGIGIARQLGHWLIGIDAVWQDYRAVQYDLHPDAAYQTGYSIRLGGRWQMPRRHLKLSDPESWSYFLGLQWNQLPIQVRQVPISSVAASLGAQIPVNSQTFLSVALVAGRRGTFDYRLVQDWFFNIAFTFSVGERWFQ